MTHNYKKYLDNYATDPDENLNTNFNYYYNGSNLQSVKFRGNLNLLMPGHHTRTYDIEMKIIDTNENFKLDLMSNLPAYQIHPNTTTVYEIIKFKRNSDDNRFSMAFRYKTKIKFTNVDRLRFHPACKSNHKVEGINDILGGAFVNQDEFAYITCDNQLKKVDFNTWNLNYNEAIFKNKKNSKRFPFTIHEWEENVVTITNPNSLNFQDFRTKKLNRILDKIYFGLDCGKISCQFKSEIYPDILYLGSAHKLIAIDLRYPRVPLVLWTHQLTQSPTIFQTTKFQENEVIGLASQRPGDMKIFNLAKFDSGPFANRFNFKPKGILATYEECLFRGNFINDQHLEEHVNFGTTGMVLYNEKDTKLHLFTRNSFYDVFHSKIHPYKICESNTMEENLEEMPCNSNLEVVKTEMYQESIDLAPSENVSTSLDYEMKNPEEIPDQFEEKFDDPEIDDEKPLISIVEIDRETVQTQTFNDLLLIPNPNNQPQKYKFKEFMVNRFKRWCKHLAKHEVAKKSRKFTVANVHKTDAIIKKYNQRHEEVEDRASDVEVPENFWIRSNFEEMNEGNSMAAMSEMAANENQNSMREIPTIDWEDSSSNSKICENLDSNEDTSTNETRKRIRTKISGRFDKFAGKKLQNPYSRVFMRESLPRNKQVLKPKEKPSWQKSVPELLGYKDVMASDLLSIWEVGLLDHDRTPSPLEGHSGMINAWIESTTINRPQMTVDNDMQELESIIDKEEPQISQNPIQYTQTFLQEDLELNSSTQKEKKSAKNKKTYVQGF